MGAVADRWWNDRPAAARTLVQAVAEWCRTHDDRVVMVFDGRPDAAAAHLAGGNLSVEFAPRRGRDAADDRIVELAAELVEDGAQLTVVTSDRGLRARLPAGVAVVGSGRFRREHGV